jgi:hypothetical protein
MRTLVQKFLLLSVLLVCPALAHSQTTYTLTDLGPSIAFALDPVAPVVVGTYFTPDQIAAILYPNPTVLGTLPGGLFSVANFTRNGLTVGYCGTGQFSLFTHACAYTTTDGVLDLGTLGDPSLFSAAAAVNAAGHIAVYGDNPSQTFLVPWVVVDGMQVLLRLPDGGSGFPSGINDADYVIGSAMFDDGLFHAILWTLTGAYFDLGADSQAVAINNSDGSVLVQDATPEGTRAGIFRQDGHHRLAPLPGDVESRAGGLNDAGVSVGTSEPFARDFPSRMPHIVLWMADDTPVDVTPLVVNADGWVLQEGRDINNLGLIIGEGLFHGERHGFLLTPVEMLVVQDDPVTLPVEAAPAPLEEMPLPVVMSTLSDDAVLHRAMRHRRHQ